MEARDFTNNLLVAVQLLAFRLPETADRWNRGSAIQSEKVESRNEIVFSKKKKYNDRCEEDANDIEYVFGEKRPNKCRFDFTKVKSERRDIITTSVSFFSFFWKVISDAGHAAQLAASGSFENGPRLPWESTSKNISVYPPLRYCNLFRSHNFRS